MVVLRAEDDPAATAATLARGFHRWHEGSA